MKVKIRQALSNIDGIKKVITCSELDKADYDSKYRGHLTCINECKARIKFTQRKNNNKFFSTWNNEGTLHNEDCPYSVKYKGVKGRKRLASYHKSIEIDDDAVFNRLKRKYSESHKTPTGKEYLAPEGGSRKIIDTGNENASKLVNGKNGNTSHAGDYIRHKDANYVTKDDIGCLLSVYGNINSAWIKRKTNKDKIEFAYINYDVKHSTGNFLSVNILFSDDFYHNTDIDEFEIFFKKLKEMIDISKNTSETPVEVIAYGEIAKKKRIVNGVNVLVRHPKHILVNGMSYYEIINSK